MPSIYFNTEIGQAIDIETARQALLQAADAYHRMKKHCSAIYRECQDAGIISLIRDKHGFSHNLKDCLHSIPKENLSKVLLLLGGINHGSVIEKQCFEQLDSWVVEQIGVHSPLMEYAAKKNGMLLTIAVTSDWKCDFFTFAHDATQRLPNLWGQEDVLPLEQWLESWYETYRSPVEQLLRRCNDLTLCNRALTESDFTPQEFENIIQHFVRARARDYAVDNSLIKDLLPHRTKHGPLYELRLHSDGIRVLFSLQERMPVVGGYYRYGTGENLVRASKSRIAVTRINANSR